MALKLAVNISFLFKERPFLERFSAAASAGRANKHVWLPVQSWTWQLKVLCRFQRCGMGSRNSRSVQRARACGCQGEGRRGCDRSLYTSRCVFCFQTSSLHVHWNTNDDVTGNNKAWMSEWRFLNVRYFSRWEGVCRTPRERDWLQNFSEHSHWVCRSSQMSKVSQWEAVSKC